MANDRLKFWKGRWWRRGGNSNQESEEAESRIVHCNRPDLNSSTGFENSHQILSLSLSRLLCGCTHAHINMPLLSLLMSRNSICSQSCNWKAQKRKKERKTRISKLMRSCSIVKNLTIGVRGNFAAAGMRQIAHRQPSIHGTVSYQWRSSNSSEEQHTGTSQRSQFSHQQDSVLTGQSVYGYLWHSSWFSASHATFGKMYAALEATGR